MYKINHIIISNFRNHKYLKLNINKKNIFLYGKNGIGKTNIIEAISLISKNRIIRTKKLDDILYYDNENDKRENNFNIYISIKSEDRLIDNINLSYNIINHKKVIRINDKKTSNIDKSLPYILWFTPQMDYLFNSSKSTRRLLLDKITNDIYHNHNNLTKNYLNIAKNRLNMINNNINDNSLNMAEDHLSNLAYEITLSRYEAIKKLQIYINQIEILDIKLTIKEIDDDIYKYISDKNEFTTKYKNKLQNNRNLDKYSKRNNFGINLTDIKGEIISNSKINLSSTGQQKIILLTIILARALMLKKQNQNIILLLDEIMSNLDDNNRRKLFNEINKLNIQNLITSNEKIIFDDLENNNINDEIEYILIK